MIVPLIGKILILSSVMGLGYYLDRAGRISRDGLQALSGLVIHYLLPCLAFSALIDNFSRDMLSRAGILPLLGFVSFVIGLLVGWVSVQGLHLAPSAKKTYVFLASVSNYGFLPLPLVYLLYGDAGVALLFFQNLGCHLFFWTFGIWGLSGWEFSLRSFRNILNSNFFALMAGLIIAVAGWQKFVPSIVMDLARMLGLGAIPLILIVIGSTLAEIRIGRNMPWKALSMVTLVRLIVAPALFIGVLYLFDIPQAYRILCILVALMPCASSTPIFVAEYGGDRMFAAQAVLVTMLASLVTIPLGLAWFL